MEREQPEYFSYLLRLWRADDERPAWRAALKSSHTGEEVGFGSLDELFDYLRCEAGLEPGGTSRDEEDWTIRPESGPGSSVTSCCTVQESALHRWP